MVMSSGSRPASSISCGNAEATYALLRVWLKNVEKR